MKRHDRRFFSPIPYRSSFEWNQAPYDVPDMFAKPGTPCNDYNGYCDVFRKCREVFIASHYLILRLFLFFVIDVWYNDSLSCWQVDPQGPIATLRKFFFSDEKFASMKKWSYDHWYYCGLILITFVVFMASFTIICNFYVIFLLIPRR